MPRPKKDRAYSRVLGGRIRALREDLGMGQIEFLDYVAREAKVRYRQSRLSGIENGDTIITADEVRVFGSLFPGGTEELLHGKQPDVRMVDNSVAPAPHDGTMRLPPAATPPLIDPAVLRQRKQQRRR